MANRYWNPAANANWNDVNSWAETDGGATGFSVPTSSDDVSFTNTNNYNCTVNATGYCKNLDFTDYAGTFEMPGGRYFYCSGDLTFSAAMTLSFGNYCMFYMNIAYPNTAYITCNGVVAQTASVYGTFITTNGEFHLLDNFTLGKKCYFQQEGGKFYTDNYNMDVHILQTGISEIHLGSSAITVHQNVVLHTSTTFDCGTSTITIGDVSTVYNSAGMDGKGKTFYNVEIKGITNASIAGANTFNNLTFNPGAMYFEVELSASQTITGTFTDTGNSDRYRLLTCSDTPGTARTITAANVSAQYADFRDITGAGAGLWNLSAITGGSGDCGGNSDITFSTPRTMYWVGNGGITYDATHWSSSSGGAGSYGVPRAQDTLRVDANSFSSASQTVTIGLRAHGSWDWTGVTNSPTVNFNFMSNYYGSMTLVSGMSVTGTSALYFRGRGTHTITSAGKSFASSIFSFSGPGGTYTLQDALVNDGTIYHQYGTLDANDFDVTCQAFNSNYTVTRVLYMGSGTWTVTSTGYVWRINRSSFTLYKETATIKLTNNSSSSKSLQFGAPATTYYNLWVATLGTGVVSMVDSAGHTFNQIKISDGAIFKFKAGYTTTVSSFVAVGTSAITITSSTAATHTLSCASGTIDAEYCTISYSIATGGATWNAWTSKNNVDGGNNTGWIFTEPAGGVANNAFWFGG